MSEFTASNGITEQDGTLTATITFAAQTGLTWDFSGLPDGVKDQAYSGVVKVSRQPNCSGDFAITLHTGSSLPPGLSVGSVTQINNDSASLAVTGTPTTVATTTGIQFDATDGVQSATSLAQDIEIVASAPAGAVVQHKAVTNNAWNSTYDVQLDVAPTAGNLLLIAAFKPLANQTYTPPAGFTDASGSQTTSRPTGLFWKVSDGTETGPITVGATGNAGCGLTIVEFTNATHVASATGNSVAAGTSTPTVGPSATPVQEATPVFATVSRNGATHVSSVEPGWTFEGDAVSSPNLAPTVSYRQTKTTAAVSEQITLDQATSDWYQWLSTFIW